MPIEVGFWRLNGNQPARLESSGLDQESRLEDILASDLDILNPGLLLIGRQVPTSYGKFIDLLALDAQGNVVVIELKRDRTPREVVAQLLDYGSWVRGLTDDQLATIFETFLAKYQKASIGLSLDDAFDKRFGKEIPEELNTQHELVIVASELDPSTERIVTYLADQYGAQINAVFFRVFKDGGNEYLSRVWLRDPTEVEIASANRPNAGDWNGEFYVSFGHDDERHWDDARTLGYIAAGGGSWYSKTLSILEPGARIWVNVPKHGYVGVGEVLDTVKSINDFTVPLNGKQVPITEATKRLPSGQVSEDKREHFVRVRWIKAVPLNQAVKERGFFGNQNSAAKPTAAKWVHTIARLKQRFSIPDPT
jgi:hypothetical protein